MAVPTQLSDLSATAASNSPAGGDTVGTTMDDYLRAIQSIIVRISAGTDAMATPNIGAATGTSLVLSGLATVNGAFTSLGLDDNATAKALTLSGSGANSVTIANSAGNPTIGSSAGALSFNPVGQGEALRVTTGGASTVNYWSLSGALTGSRLTLLATGSDANVGASWQTKGSGSHLFVTETGTSAQVEILHTASATRYLTLTGSAGGNPTIGTSAGDLTLSAGGAAGIVIASVASAANYLYVTPAVLANENVVLRPAGSATNIALVMSSKGSGGLAFYTNATTDLQAVITHTASADRYITLTGSNGGNPTIGTSAGNLNLSSAVSCLDNLAVGADDALGAGGVGSKGLFLSSSSIAVIAGSGAPTISAAKGSLYLRSDGTATNNRMYVNTDGATTWTAVTTVA